MMPHKTQIEKDGEIKAHARFTQKIKIFRVISKLSNCTTMKNSRDA